ncbi:MAG: peptidylprolyl isomerase [Nitrospirae bacterium]|nr:peptidylprolyl isomerase [Nitrospirota bacterium]
MAQVKRGDNVKVHYTCTLKDGTIVDSTMNQQPLQFTVGKGQVLPSLEEAVEGMKQGEAKDITIPSDKAFGPHKEEMVQVVDRNRLPADLKVNAGMKLQTNQGGQPIDFTVIDVSESTVTLDFNHPLAGKELLFNVNVAEIS